MKHIKILFNIIFALLVILFHSPHSEAGVISKTITTVGKKGGTIISKEVAEKAMKEAFEKAAKLQQRQLKKTFTGTEGETLTHTITKLSRSTGKSKELLAKELINNKKYVRRYLKNGNHEAIEMALRNGDGGWFLIKRFPNRFTKGSKWLDQNADEAIQEAWNLVDPKSASGSWVKLRQSMTKAGLNGPERDFAEDLFYNRLKAGRITGLPKKATYFDGHIGSKRQGLDFIGVKDGRPMIIEFSTGRKPSPGNPLQMTDEKVKDLWLEIISDTNHRINLKNAGISKELLNPNLIRNSNFKIEKQFDKIIAAPEISLSHASKIGCKRVILQ